MAIATVVAVGATLATGALPALANQTDQFNIINAAGIPMYMVSNNVPNAPLFVNDGGACACGTPFSNINGQTSYINGHAEPVYEWQEVGTNRCWTHMADDGYLETQTCNSSNTDQMFWQTTSGQFINVASSNEHGSHYCVNAVHSTSPGGTSDPINIIACKSRTASGGFDQYWTAMP
jgi:hypothetical protein